MSVLPIVVDYLPIFENNYIWLIMNRTRDTVIAVDPGDASPLFDYLNLKQVKLEAILITHHHRDHTGGINKLKKQYDVKVYGPQHESIDGVSDGVAEGSCIEFPFLASSFSILDIPGHTLGHIAYYVPGSLFCGDTLFSAGCGRLFEGTAEQMYQSLQKIAALPEDTTLYCTHEYTLQNLKFAQLIEPHNVDIQVKINHVQALRQANLPSLPALLSEEKKINPFLRCHIPEVVANAEQYAGSAFNSAVDVFRALRAWKDQM